MDAFFSTQRIALAVVGLGALFAASVAQARTDVHLSVGVPGYVQPAPVYVQPRPVYVQPQPVYVQPRPVYVQPHPVYSQPRPVYVQPRQVYVQPAPVYLAPHARVQHHWEGHGGHRGHGRYGDGYPGRRFGPHGDLDRDGVANHQDRDRDGDGVRNRHDRVPNNRFQY